MKSDRNIIYERIKSVDVPTEISLNHEELADEFAFAPYVDNKVPMIDLGCLEIPEENKSVDKQNPPIDISNSIPSTFIP